MAVIGDVVTDTATGLSGKIIAFSGDMVRCRVIYNLSNSQSDFMAQQVRIIPAAAVVREQANALAIEEGPQPPAL